MRSWSWLWRSSRCARARTDGDKSNGSIAQNSSTTDDSNTDDSNTDDSNTDDSNIDDSSNNAAGATSAGSFGGQKPKPTAAVIRVVDGKPAGGVKSITFSKGDQVRLKVNSDTADEVHIHGYDIHKHVEAGGSVRFAFPASIDGRFEIELEDATEQIAELEVEP